MTKKVDRLFVEAVSIHLWTDVKLKPYIDQIKEACVQDEDTYKLVLQWKDAQSNKEKDHLANLIIMRSAA